MVRLKWSTRSSDCSALYAIKMDSRGWSCWLLTSRTYTEYGTPIISFAPTARVSTQRQRNWLSTYCESTVESRTLWGSIRSRGVMSDSSTASSWLRDCSSTWHIIHSLILRDLNGRWKTLLTIKIHQQKKKLYDIRIIYFVIVLMISNDLFSIYSPRQ